MLLCLPDIYGMSVVVVMAPKHTFVACIPEERKLKVWLHDSFLAVLCSDSYKLHFVENVGEL